MSMIACATRTSYRQPRRRGDGRICVRAVITAAGLLVSGWAHADDAASVTVTERSPLLHPDDEPMLRLEALPAPVFRGIVNVDEGTLARIDAGAHSVVEVDVARISSQLDVPERGWSAGIRAVHDFGWFTGALSARLEHTDSRFAEGTHYDVNLTLAKSKRLSRWMTAWVALSVGYRHWLGDALPPGESRDSLGVTLSIGTTFK